MIDVYLAGVVTMAGVGTGIVVFDRLINYKNKYDFIISTTTGLAIVTLASVTWPISVSVTSIVKLLPLFRVD